MPKFINMTRRFLPRMLPRRTGSILIMVVAVLVLLALMGTAYISTARIDRTTSVPLNAATPDEVLDELIKTVSGMAETTILNDISPPADGYRSPIGTTYDHWDCYMTNLHVFGATPNGIGTAIPKNDAWLSPRIPDVITNPSTAVYVTWRSLTRPINQADPLTDGNEIFFESPFAEQGLFNNPTNPVWQLGYPRWTIDPLTQRAIATELTVTYPQNFSDTSLANKTRVFPAFELANVAGTPLTNNTNNHRYKYLAADADGNGIADSGLVYLSTVDGVRYYYACRIIDGNSAINVTTAWSMIGDMDAEGVAAPNAQATWFFPASVGLQELLNTWNTDVNNSLSTEMDEINRYRNGYMLPNPPFAPTPTNLTNAPFAATFQPVADEEVFPVPLTPANRGDFAYVTQYEAQYFRLASRISRPGFRAEGDLNNINPPNPNNSNSQTSTSNARRYRQFTLDLDLMYHGDFINPEGTVDIGNAPVEKWPRGPIEQLFYKQATVELMNDSIYHTSTNFATAVGDRFKYLPADKAFYWGTYNYDFNDSRRQNSWFSMAADGGPTPPPHVYRSLLTTYNPISNYAPSHQVTGGNVPHDAMLPFGNRGRWDDQYNYRVGDVVYHRPMAPVGVIESWLYYSLSANTDIVPESSLGTDWVRMIPRGVWNAATAYVAGDVVRFADAAAPPNYTIWIATGPVTGGMPPAAPWAPAPGYASPPKASLNTAPFAELFRAFWNVMVETVGNGTPFDTPYGGQTGGAPAETNAAAGAVPATFNNSYVGMQFFDQFAAGPVPGPFGPKVLAIDTAPLPPTNDARMFRSPIRAVPDIAAGYTPLTPRMTPQAAMMMRAAIAAVNAEDMRDADSDVTARKITLPVQIGAAVASCDVVVYGTEAQPYITEIYANTDTSSLGGAGATANPNGYVAIELYNPYPFDIPLTEWRLAVLNRIPLGAAGANPPAAGMPGVNHMPLVAAQELVNFSDVFGGTAYPTPVVPARGYLLLENYIDPADPVYLAYRTARGAAVSPATYRPAGTGLPQNGPIPMANDGGSPSTVASLRAAPMARLNVAYLPLPAASLVAPPPHNTVFNQEMVFLKRRNFDGTVYNAGVARPEIGYTNDGIANLNYLHDFIPVDSYDFTGLVLPIAGYMSPSAPPVAPPSGACWHYMRASSRDPAAPSGTKNWHFVYPGRYDATNTIVSPGNPLMRARQQGTREATWAAGLPIYQTEPWDADGTGTYDPGHPFNPAPPGAARPVGPEMTLGVNYYAAGIAADSGAGEATYPTTFAIQLAYNNFIEAPPFPGTSIGYNPVVGPAGNAFPFGGFMRNGDVLHVPFIGAYRIKINDPAAVGVPPDTVLEMNSVTMDSAMAEDTYVDDNPMYVIGSGALADTGAITEVREQVGRFCPHHTAGPLFSYDWAVDVLDYVTAIQNPNDDHIPNVDPARYAAVPGAIAPQPVSNLPGKFANTDQDFPAGVHGLINVNTAPLRVLAQVPLVTNAAGEVDVPLTQQLAQAIVDYRDIEGETPGVPHGPFKSLFELNAVLQTGTANGFANMMGVLDFATPAFDPGDGFGDFTPQTDTAIVAGGVQPDEDQVKLDFEERNLNLMRLSNLLTTRSDVYTCYVLVQGWKNVGTTTPQLVAERRAAFVVDRSATASNDLTTKQTPVPTR